MLWFWPVYPGPSASRRALSSAVAVLSHESPAIVSTRKWYGPSCSQVTFPDGPGQTSKISLRIPAWNSQSTDCGTPIYRSEPASMHSNRPNGSVVSVVVSEVVAEDVAVVVAVDVAVVVAVDVMEVVWDDVTEDVCVEVTLVVCEDVPVVVGDVVCEVVSVVDTDDVAVVVCVEVTLDVTVVVADVVPVDVCDVVPVVVAVVEGHVPQ